ncbi:DNA topoisomerase IV [Litoribacter populi]|uniref:DNA topoisomerase IV n=1 Tax=Litoribacter populi TaxID=2598460 RepID=UPI00118151C9|nr:DNA topoisomerase IV [Litoribacter populi]
MYRRFAKAFHFLSILLFIILFMYIYAALPENVAYQVDASGMPLKSIARDTFFYFGIAAFIILNLIIVFAGKMVEKQATPNLRKLFPTGDPFSDKMLGWIYSFAGVLNVSLVIIAFFVHRINNQYEIQTEEFNPFFYMIPVFMVVWIILLFVILGKKLNQVRS